MLFSKSLSIVTLTLATITLAFPLPTPVPQGLETETYALVDDLLGYDIGAESDGALGLDLGDLGLGLGL